MAEQKTVQWPPVRVKTEDAAKVEKRAEACGLTLTEYIRYRVLGKRVLTGDELDRVKEHEKPVE